MLRKVRDVKQANQNGWPASVVGGRGSLPLPLTIVKIFRLDNILKLMIN